MRSPRARRQFLAGLAAVCLGVALAPPAVGAVGFDVVVRDPAAVDTIVEAIDLSNVSESGSTEPGLDDPAATEPHGHLHHDDHDPTTESRGQDELVGLSDRLQLNSDQVTTLGVVWDVPVDDIAVEVRTADDDTWGPWTELHVEAVSADEGRPGTDPFVVTHAAGVQVRVLSAEGHAVPGVTLFVVGAGQTPEPVVEEGKALVEQSSVNAPAAGPAAHAGVATRSLAQVAATSSGSSVQSVPAVPTSAVLQAGPITAPRPAIHQRSEWGAAAFRGGSPEIVDVQAAVVHHTVTDNAYSAAQVPAILRSIQAYHQNGRGWSDIGYNFLVDRFGRIWEGRQGGVDKEIRGVHASEANSVSTGISVIGTHDVAAVPAVVTDALVRLVAWKLALHDVVVGETFVLGGQTFPNVIGHRQVPTAATACPGRYLLPLLPSVRVRAAALQSFVPVTMSRTLTGPGAQDVLATGSPSQILTLDAAALGPPTTVGTGWQGMDLIAGSPSLRSGSTSPAIVARHQGNGRLYVYEGNGRSGIASTTVVGHGWGGMSHILTPGDFDGDGHADLLAVSRSTGQMLLYRGNGGLRFTGPVVVGTGWGGMRALVATPDITGDGLPDVVAVLGNGKVWIYPGTGRGSFRAPMGIADGYATVDSVVAPGDVTGDGLRDIVLRDGSTGRMITLPGRGDGRVRIGQPWGQGWDRRGPIASGLHWSGPGRGSVLAIAASGTLEQFQPSVDLTFVSAPASDLDTASATEVVVAGDVTGSGLADVVTRSPDGRLWLHESMSGGSFAPPRQVGSGWNGFESIVAVGDIDYDGAPDLMGIYRDGRLFVYPFLPDRSGTFGQSYVIGQGFTGYRLVAVPGWRPGAGTTVLAINPVTGDLRAFHARGSAWLTGGETIGYGWGSFTGLAVLPDPTGSGTPGLLARHRNGSTWVYMGNGRGGFGSRLDVRGVPSGAGTLLR